MTSTSPINIEYRIQKIEDIIGTDAGGRGMKSLFCPGDLLAAGRALGTLEASKHVVVLSGFPCCVDETPPSETDGPPGSMALCQTSLALGHSVVFVTDDCNQAVFAAAAEDLMASNWSSNFSVQTFPADLSQNDENRLQQLATACDLLVACERAGPGRDGNCYTMRGIDMNANGRGLVAPLDRLVTELRKRKKQQEDQQEARPPLFLAVGDGGNELGMGKVIDAIRNSIPKGEQIGCVVAADHLVAASVSNWGGYALSAAAALWRSTQDPRFATSNQEQADKIVQEWIERCLPSEEKEIALLDRSVQAGCRDGVSGRMEATVDGMPLERSLQCLRDIRSAALGK